MALNGFSTLNVGSAPSLFSHIDMQQHMMNPSAGFQQAIASQPIGFKQGLAPKRKAAQLVAEHQELEDPDDVLSRQVQHQMEVGFRALSSSLSSQLKPLLQLAPALQQITTQWDPLVQHVAKQDETLKKQGGRIGQALGECGPHQREDRRAQGHVARLCFG